MNWRVREIAIVTAVLAIGWIALMIGLSRLQNRTPQESSLPQFPHYPGTETIQEQVMSGATDIRKYWFFFNEDYPATTVYRWYQKQLTGEGTWFHPGSSEPTWVRTQQKDKSVDVFTAVWLSQDKLFEIDLEMVSTVPIMKQYGETIVKSRDPGMKVYVTLRRNMVFWGISEEKQ